MFAYRETRCRFCDEIPGQGEDLGHCTMCGAGVCAGCGGIVPAPDTGESVCRPCYAALVRVGLPPAYAPAAQPGRPEGATPGGPC